MSDMIDYYEEVLLLRKKVEKYETLLTKASILKGDKKMDVNTIKHILEFLSRVDLKGSEAPTFMAVVEKLRAHAASLDLPAEQADTASYMHGRHEEDTLPDA